MSQSRSNKEIIELFFEDQNNIWKGEAGMTIAECKTAEKELLRTILAQKDAEVAEAFKKFKQEAMRKFVMSINEAEPSFNDPEAAYIEESFKAAISTPKN